jgi:Flp pilus assembly protein TadG
MSKSPKNRRGAVAVEFAMVAPLFLFLVFGLFEFGRMLMLHQALTNATREGCRAAGLASCIDTSRVDSAVRDYLASVVGDNAADAAIVRVTMPSSLNGVTSGTDLTVGVEVDFKDVSWLPIGHLRSTAVISSEARRKRE